MPLDTLHTLHGILERRDDQFFVVAGEGGEWELELAPRLSKYHGCPVTIEGVRTGFNRLEVVRIKRDGEDWPPHSTWTQWFNLRKREQ